jgi:hypothetical protein
MASKPLLSVVEKETEKGAFWELRGRKRPGGPVGPSFCIWAPGCDLARNWPCEMLHY